MEDVVIHWLLHGVVTAFNLVRFTGETPQARLNTIHGWRVIDFDHSLNLDMENENAPAKENWTYTGSSATFCGNLLV